jgi:hypothetical protein
MKKLLLIVATFLLVVSGVVAVSAYEAHLVNVKARVELALVVDKTSIDFGNCFPEEWRTEVIKIAQSDSFTAQTRVDSVDFAVYAQRNPDSNLFWLGDAMYARVIPAETSVWNAVGLTPIGADPGQGGKVGPIATGTIDKNPVQGGGLPARAFVGIGLDVPDFEGFVNSNTDVSPKPSGLTLPTVVIPNSDPRHGVPVNTTDPHYDGGIQLVIQVTNIYDDGVDPANNG